MLHLPLYLEKKLKDLFPSTQDRYDFVSKVVEDALQQMEASHARQQQHTDLPRHIGGTLHLFSDGGSRGNPGEAAIGYVLEDPARGEVLFSHGESIGQETNNVAEYRALIEGLKKAIEYCPNRLICHLDSELIVRQLSGQYRVKMPHLQPYFEQIQKLTQELPDVVFRHIVRADNHKADRLVNLALDRAGY